jgi:uncharacterized SAM-binding protein YcdF (DUF218 family)
MSEPSPIVAGKAAQVPITVWVLVSATRSAIASVVARLVEAPLSHRSFSPLQTADAIVVLGAPLGRDETLSAIAEERVRAGVAMYEKKLAPIVCVTGGFGHGTARGTVGRIPESEAMAERMRRLGVPAASILVDRSARSTRENAERAAELLLGDGRRRVWIVTQPFHLRRARYHFREAGFEPLGWHIEDSLQYREPQRFLRWMVREYAAWGAIGLGIDRQSG